MKILQLFFVDTKEDNEPILPAAQPLQTLFNKRAAFISGEDISGRFKTDFVFRKFLKEIFNPIYSVSLNKFYVFPKPNITTSC